MKLHRNMHRIDQALRILIGVALVYFGFFDHSLINDTLFATLVGVFGIVNVVSASVGVCPFYTIAGIGTHKDAGSIV